MFTFPLIQTSFNTPTHLRSFLVPDLTTSAKCGRILDRCSRKEVEMSDEQAARRILMGVVLALYLAAFGWLIAIGEWHIAVCTFLAIWAAKIEMKYFD